MFFISGQAFVDLSESNYWKKGGLFKLDLNFMEFEVKDSFGIEKKADFRQKPKGSIEFELIPIQGMGSECGYVIGPCVDDIIRALHQLPKFSGYEVNNKTHTTDNKKGNIRKICNKHETF